MSGLTVGLAAAAKQVERKTVNKIMVRIVEVFVNAFCLLMLEIIFMVGCNLWGYVLTMNYSSVNYVI